MNITNLIAEIKNPFQHYHHLTEDEIDIVCEVHSILSKFYLQTERRIFLEWRHDDEYYLRSIFEALGFGVEIDEDENDNTPYGISIYRKDV